MFKSSLSSYIPWFKKSKSALNGSAAAAGATNEAEYCEGPLVVPSLDHTQLINISMKDEDDSQSFVDIQYRKLTYAEAASLGPGRSSTHMETSSHRASTKPKSKAKPPHAKPRKERAPENQYAVLEDSVEIEPFKSDVNYRKSKQFKSKQFDTVQKKKQKNALKKAST